VTIQIQSWQNILAFVLTLVAVLGALATMHWKLFAAPTLKKMLTPLAQGLTVTRRVVQEQHPEAFERAEAAAAREAELWSGI
jgi:hypothetical protein